MEKDLQVIASIVMIVGSMIGSVAAMPKAIKAMKLFAKQLYNVIPPRLLPKEWKTIVGLVKLEAGPVLFTGIILNAVGFGLSTRFPSILYLDMVGTAFVCIALGPWFGALVAATSSLVIHPVITSDQGDALVNVVPWVLVSVTGAIFWGYVGRLNSLKAYIQRNSSPWLDHVKFVLLMGVGGAVVMAIPGAFVQMQLPKDGLTYAFEKTADSGINQIATDLRNSMPEFVAIWLTNAFRYIPDKAFSVGLGVIMLRALFPFAAHHRVYSVFVGSFSKISWCIPLCFILVYSWVVLIVLRSPELSDMWFVWLVPVIVALVVALYRSRQASKTVPLTQNFVLGVASTKSPYDVFRTLRLSKRLNQKARRLYSFAMMWHVLLLLSVIFVLGVPLLAERPVYLIVNYFSVVYGFASVGVVIRFAAVQHLALHI